MDGDSVIFAARKREMLLNTPDTIVQTWVQLFNRGDMEALDALRHAPAKASDTAYLQRLFEAGFRISGSSIKRFVEYPNWSIFRTYRLQPTPEYWVDLSMENSEGRTNEIYLALAPSGSDYKTSTYVEIARKPVRKLDLRAERAHVDTFLRRTWAAIHKLKTPPIQGVVASFSVEMGYVHINLNTESSEPGLSPTVERFRECPRWNWADFLETGHQLLDATGQLLLRRDMRSNIWGPQELNLDSLIGNMLVESLKAYRDSGEMPLRNFAQEAEFGVEEHDGAFGWPPYEERGRGNRLHAELGLGNR